MAVGCLLVSFGGSCLAIGYVLVRIWWVPGWLMFALCWFGCPLFGLYFFIIVGFELAWLAVGWKVSSSLA